MRPFSAIAERAWVGLAALGGITALLSLLDIAADLSSGMPADHRQVFLAVSGTSWEAARGTAIGTYVTALEEGYAIHELALALVLVLVAALPLRDGRRWAWVGCWALGLAIVGYAVLFGSHDTTIFQYALVEGVVFLVCMLAMAPTMLEAQGREAAPSGG